MTTKIKKLTKLYSIIIVSIILFSPASVFAGNCKDGDAADCLSKATPLMQIITVAINFLTGAVIIIGTIMLIVAGIEYITANGNPDKVTKAKQKIGDVVLGVVAYFLLYAFLKWLIPNDGGIFF